MNPITDEAGRMMGTGANEKRSFVKVEAGRTGYVMVADLPKNVQATDAPGEDDLARAAVSLTDRDHGTHSLWLTRRNSSSSAVNDRGTKSGWR